MFETITAESHVIVLPTVVAIAGVVPVAAVIVAMNPRWAIENTPWRYVVFAVERIRKRFFSVDWPERAPSFVVDVDAAELEDLLRADERAEGMLASYRYAGEQLNLRIPWGLDGDGRPLELHIRGRPVEEGLELIAHVEASRYECKEAHIQGDGLDWEAGYEATRVLVGEHVEIVSE